MLIAAEWVVPVTSLPVRRHVVRIENGSIQEFRPAGEAEAVAENVCIMPGLINTHTHLAYTRFRNAFDDLPFFSWIRRLTEARMKATRAETADSTKEGIRECLRAGITAVADLSDIEESLSVLSESPLRGIYYWEVFGVEKEQAERSWMFLQNEFPALRDRYESDRLQLGVSPHSCYTVRPELFERIGRWAVDKKIPVSFHAAESSSEEEFISQRSGVIEQLLKIRAADWTINSPSSISHLEKTGIFRTKPVVAHAVQASQDDVKILAGHDVAIAHCPKSNAKFGHGVAPLLRFMDAGLRIGLGTDSAASNNRLDLFEEGRFALFQQRAANHDMVLTEQQILELMTINGARALGMESSIGSIEVGKKADLLAIRLPQKFLEPDQLLNFLVYTCGTEQVSKVFIDGREVESDAI